MVQGTDRFQDYVPVCIFDDGNFLHGTHVALFTAIQNSSKPLRIYFFHNGLHPSQIELLKETCRRAGVIDGFMSTYVSLELFRSFRSLVGNKFAYARLLVGRYIQEERCIYFDSDVIVETDLSLLIETSLDQHVLGAVQTNIVNDSLEKNFFREILCDDNMPILNSGVLLIDLDAWRDREIEQKCLSFGRLYADRLQTADQSILNGVLRGKFKRLPSQFNVPAYPSADPNAVPAEAILHFIGSPKPWDPFSRFFHRFFKIFSEASAQTAFPVRFGFHSPRQFWRLIRISPACFRILLRKWK